MSLCFSAIHTPVNVDVKPVTRLPRKMGPLDLSVLLTKGPNTRITAEDA